MTSDLIKTITAEAAKQHVEGFTEAEARENIRVWHLTDRSYSAVVAGEIIRDTYAKKLEIAPAKLAAAPESAPIALTAIEPVGLPTEPSAVPDNASAQSAAASVLVAELEDAPEDEEPKDDALSDVPPETPFPVQQKIQRLAWELKDVSEECGRRSDEAAVALAENAELKKKLREPTTARSAPASELYTLSADRIEAKRIEWLWQGRIPLNKLSVLAGNPDQGKSLVSLYMIAQLTRGLPMFGETGASWGKADALILAAEDEADDTIRPRLEVAGAFLDHVHILQSIAYKDSKGKTVAEREAQLDTDLQALETTLKQNPQIKLVVIDPISSFLGRANMNKEQEVRAILTPLKNLAARCQVAIVCVMHLNKSSDQSAIHRIGGAVAFTGVARACWLFTDDPEDKTRHLMVRVKNNIAKASGGLSYRTAAKPVVIDGFETPQPYVEWLGETETAASDILVAGGPVGRPPEKATGAKEWLTAFLADGEQTAVDVERHGRQAGHALGTLRRAKDELKIVSQKIENRWYWMLAGTVPGARTVSFEDQDAQNSEIQDAQNSGNQDAQN